MKKFLRVVKRFFERKLKFYRRIGLKNKSVAIISNNCTGGYVYQYFGLEYHSPTAGLFFTGTDYVKLCKNLKYYFSQKLEFIDWSQSSNSNIGGGYPIARLADIEIYFMHYRSREEAAEKWYRRVARIAYNNVFFLFAESEISSKEDVLEFCNMPCENKICMSFNDYGDKTIFSKRVAEMNSPSWFPEIVLSLIDWKKTLNDLEKK